MVRISESEGLGAGTRALKALSLILDPVIYEAEDCYDEGAKIHEQNS